MFRCRECGCEYDIKPDFCDCGNDTFDETAGTAKQEQPIQEPFQPTNNYSQQSELERVRNFFDPISTTVFLICIITSIVVIFFIGNPKEQTPKPQPEQSETQQVSIPDIETFWNNSTAGIINNEKSAQQAVSKSVEPMNKTKPQVPQPQPKQEQTAVSPKNNSIASRIQQNFGINQAKTQAPAKTTKTQTSAKPTQTQPAAKTPTPKIPKKTQDIANQPKTQKSTSTKTQSQNVQSPKPQQTQTKQKPQQQVNIPQPALRPKATIDTAALARELHNYKTGLRNTIGRKVDFTKVIGDGECIVAFKVDSNGKLINRSFAKQSNNITLNDAVYKAVMSTPSYNPPPAGYKNEILNLKVRFFNGNYDISLP